MYIEFGYCIDGTICYSNGSAELFVVILQNVDNFCLGMWYPVISDLCQVSFDSDTSLHEGVVECSYHCGGVAR